jgi:hypothetical protein
MFYPPQFSIANPHQMFPLPEFALETHAFGDPNRSWLPPGWLDENGLSRLAIGPFFDVDFQRRFASSDPVRC